MLCGAHHGPESNQERPNAAGLIVLTALFAHTGARFRSLAACATSPAALALLPSLSLPSFFTGKALRRLKWRDLRWDGMARHGKEPARRAVSDLAICIRRWMRTDNLTSLGLPSVFFDLDLDLELLAACCAACFVSPLARCTCTFLPVLPTYLPAYLPTSCPTY